MNKPFRTKKQFGQHLLVSKDVISRIVDVLEVNQDDIIIEIGVGTGNLTEEILKRNPKILYGIEIDETAYPIIEEKFSGKESFNLIKADFFDVELKKLIDNFDVKFTGNLPYNVASNIIIDTVFYLKNIRLCVFMVQKEVAEKLVAVPKSKNYTFLSVFTQTFYHVEYIMSVPARFFKPPPKVTSAVVKLTPKRPAPDVDITEYKKFVSELFQNRRKMLRSKLNSDLLIKTGIKPESRVEQLSVEDIIKLYGVLKDGNRQSGS